MINYCKNIEIIISIISLISLCALYKIYKYHIRQYSKSGEIVETDNFIIFPKNNIVLFIKSNIQSLLSFNNILFVLYFIFKSLNDFNMKIDYFVNKFTYVCFVITCVLIVQLLMYITQKPLYKIIITNRISNRDLLKVIYIPGFITIIINNMIIMVISCLLIIENCEYRKRRGLF